jgi:tetratricopeptide (TPR) repeat protein
MLGSFYLELGKLRLAIRHRSAAVRTYEKVGDLIGLVVAHNNLGTSYQLLGQLDDAIPEYEASVEVAERIGNHSAAAVVHSNIGEVLLIKGRWSQAISHFRQTVETHERTGEAAVPAGLALINLSRACLRQGAYEDAAERLQEGTRLLRDAGARGLLIQAHLQEAELALETGRLDSATRSCGRALGKAGELGLQLEETRALRLRGLLALKREHWEDAEADLRESAALADRIGAEYEKGQALLDLAQVYGGRKRTKGSRRHASAIWQAVAIFKRLGATADLAGAERLQAQL